MDERNRLEGTNAARDKSMSQDSSVLPELAASPKWRRRPLSAQPMHTASMRPAPVGSSAKTQTDKIRSKGTVLLLFETGSLSDHLGGRLIGPSSGFLEVLHQKWVAGTSLFTASPRALGGGWFRGGESKERRRLLVHHHRMNTGLPATPSDTHLTSDYQTTWLNMHLRGDLS